MQKRTSDDDADEVTALREPMAPVRDPSDRPRPPDEPAAPRKRRWGTLLLLLALIAAGAALVRSADDLSLDDPPSSQSQPGDPADR